MTSSPCKGDKEIGEGIDKIIGQIANANDLHGVIDVTSFNDDAKLGKGKAMVDRLSKLVAIFDDLDFRATRADGDDLLGDAYEYLMRHFATESGKSKGQFYTPAEVSRILAKVVGIDEDADQIRPSTTRPAARDRFFSRLPMRPHGADRLRAGDGRRHLGPGADEHDPPRLRDGRDPQDDVITRPGFTQGRRAQAPRLRRRQSAVLNQVLEQRDLARER